MRPDLLAPVQSWLRGQGNLRDVERAIADGASPDSWEGPLSPMRCAVQAHNLPLLQLLLAQRADVNAKDHRGVGALHMAVFDGKVECIKLLLDAQADPNIRDRHGQTPLFFAPTRAACELLLARRAEVAVRNAKKQSPLHLAAHAGLDDAVSWFADLDRVILEAPDAKGFTPISYAAHSHVSSTVSFLKQKAEAAAAAEAVSRAAFTDEQHEPESIDCCSPVAEAAEPPPELPPARSARPSQLESDEDDAEAPAKAAAAAADATVAFARDSEATECGTPEASGSEAASRSPSPEPRRQRHVHIEVGEDEAPPGQLGPVPEEAAPPKAVQPAARAAPEATPPTVLNRQVAAAMRARGLVPLATPEPQAVSNAFELESEDSEEARAENRVPNKEVVPEEVDGCLEWEVMLKKERSTDKFGFVQANGKLEFETRLANPSQRLVGMGSKRSLQPAEASPLSGPPVLIVRRIHEGLLLHCWNQKYPKIAVRPQDRILSVNGETSLEAMQREIKSSKIIIKFRRYPQIFTVKLTKNGRRLGFKFERPPVGVDSKEVRITEICPDGALPDYNKEVVTAGRHHCAVLPDMRITQANDIVGDGGEIAEELKRCEEVTLTLRRADLPSSQTRKLRMLAAAMRGGSASAISDADGGSTVAFSWVPGASTCDGGYSPQGGSPTGAGPTLSTALED